MGKKPHMPHFLHEIHLDGIRGMDKLRVAFEYPVTVIAGGNAAGKSTVLFAAACAYKVPNAGVRDFVPSTLFPEFRPKSGTRKDPVRKVTLDYHYATPAGRQSMRWRRVKGWSRSYFGRKGATQPERMVYLRTLSNLSNPSEVRGVLSMSRMKEAPEESPLTVSQIRFAQQMLPFRYSEVVNLTSGEKSLLFASREGGSVYSELQMAAGERTLLRLAGIVDRLKDALVLIDEVEAGLHPFAQQLLLLQLQQLALRRNLQIIVTSHSPIVLNSVPALGRIFLERKQSGRVAVLPPYRDIIQNALYGRSDEQLNILCEDKVAEAILTGVLDALAPRMHIRRETVRIGCDTGAEEFPTHAKAFNSFNLVQNFVFVLDGDKQGGNLKHRILAEVSSRDVSVFFLPGNVAPEQWIWSRLQEDLAIKAEILRVDPDALSTRISDLNRIYDSASDSSAEIAKSKLEALSDVLDEDTINISRSVAYAETQRSDSDILPLMADLEDLLLQWRSTS